MFPIHSFLERFGEVLASLDALADDCPEADAEDLEDLNAELEDALLLLGELKRDDGPEEFEGVLEDIRALAGDYRAMADRVPALSALADQLEMAAGMALGNLAE